MHPEQHERAEFGRVRGESFPDEPLQGGAGHIEATREPAMQLLQGRATSIEHDGDTLREDKMGVSTHGSRPLAMISGGASSVGDGSSLADVRPTALLRGSWGCSETRGAGVAGFHGMAAQTALLVALGASALRYSRQRGSWGCGEADGAG